MSDTLQHSTVRKSEWRAEMEKRIPEGARVRVLRSDVPEYVGLTGSVTGYDLGDDGEWPLVDVVFDQPAPSGARRDAFYADGADAEIEVMS